MLRVVASFGQHQVAAETAIVNLMNKFDHLGQVSVMKSTILPHPARLAENFIIVVENVAENYFETVARIGDITSQFRS